MVAVRQDVDQSHNLRTGISLGEQLFECLHVVLPCLISENGLAPNVGPDCFNIYCTVRLKETKQVLNNS